MRRRILLLPLLCSILLTACVQEPINMQNASDSDTVTLVKAPVPGETEAPTEPATEAELPTEPPTEAPTEPLRMIGRSSVEVYEALTAASLVTDTNAELTDPDMVLPSDELGTYTAEIPCRFGSVEQTVTLQYQVVDSTPPVAVNNGEFAAVKTGNAFRIEELIGYGDNYDRSPVLTYTGNVNTGTPGVYPIEATLTDSSGNATTWTFNVTVANKLPGAASKPQETFAEFTERYAADNLRFGIDVSKWQAKIDWPAVKNAGVSFTVIRCGYGGSSISQDEYYLQNIRNASAAGLDVGVYFNSTATNPDTARAQADWIVRQIASSGVTTQLPVAFDWESWSKFQQYGINFHDLNLTYDAFAERLA
ncbi:MAG: glycoside hydrolase family 25, partial [Oscillospiraceae bacterium]|nr:glycoside hydrolase family 25 [Oscillospiraceae bacterium]